jgi:hypothetical protein
MFCLLPGSSCPSLLCYRRDLASIWQTKLPDPWPGYQHLFHRWQQLFQGLWQLSGLSGPWTKPEPEQEPEPKARTEASRGGGQGLQRNESIGLERVTKG